jgi:hypothetical protein
MKKCVYIAPAVLLALFFVVFSTFPSPFDCRAKIILYNELPSDITVIIDGQQKNLYGWGHCQEVWDANIYRIIPCSRTWIVKWGGTLHVSYCMGSREDDEYVSWYDEEYGLDEGEDKLLTCEENTIRITLVGVEGLDTTMTLRKDGVYELKVGTSGLVMLEATP